MLGFIIFKGDISVGETVTSSESFTIKINIDLTERAAPQTQTLRFLKCNNVNGIIVVEEIQLK